MRQTVITLTSGNPLIEGRNRHGFNFNLAVYPDNTADYVVQGTNLWKVTLYLSTTQDGSSVAYESTALLSSEQMSTSWIPPNVMNIGSIQTILDLEGFTCGGGHRFVCARIDRAANPSVNFYMQGTPTNSSLSGCTAITCAGK